MGKNLVLADHELGIQYLGVCGSAFNGCELGRGQTHILLKRGGELKSGLQDLIEGLVAPRTCTSGEARSIMGKNFFGLDEAVKHFGVTYSKRYAALLAEVPWSKEVLTACRDNHILVAVLPMSIFNMRDAVKGKFTIEEGPTVPGEGPWWEGQDFARERGKLGWHLIQKTVVEGSGYVGYHEQRTLLLKDEKAPMVRVMVYAIAGHFLNTGEIVGEDCVRCADVVLSSATDTLRPELRHYGRGEGLMIHHARDTENGGSLFLFAEKIPMRR